MSFEEFQYGCHGGHLAYQNGTIFHNSDSLCRSDASHQVLAQSDLQFGRCCLKIFSRWSFQDGRHGGHLGYLNETILAILNLYNAPMPPIKFLLNLTYGLGGDVS